MNDEIKVILDYLKDENDYIEDFGISYKRIHIDNGDLKLLLDYITNLQQENEYLKLSNPEMNIEHFRIINENKRKIDNLRKQNKDLQQENERLKEWKKDLLKENIELENIRKEAIEYINKNKHLSMFADCREPEEDWNYDLECSANDLLNILQNGGDSQ